MGLQPLASGMQFNISTLIRLRSSGSWLSQLQEQKLAFEMHSPMSHRSCNAKRLHSHASQFFDVAGGTLDRVAKCFDVIGFHETSQSDFRGYSRAAPRSLKPAQARPENMHRKRCAVARPKCSAI